MNLDSVYVKTGNFVEKQIGDELVLVPIVDHIAKMTEVFTLNEVAAFIWNRISIDYSLAQILEQLNSSFEVESTKANEDLVRFVQEALIKNIIKPAEA